MAARSEDSVFDFPFSSSTHALLEREDLSDPNSYRKSIDRRIRELKREIEALDFRKNALAYPNLLPPELLSHIFLICAQQENSRPGAYNGSTLWISIAHVCQHWRRVALNCGALWADLSFVNPQFTKMMVERSKDSPVSLKYNSSQEDGGRFDEILAQILARECDRLTTVDLAGSRHAPNLPALLENLGARGPILETLSIDGSYRSAELPKVFNLGGAPRLRELKLINLTLQWDKIPLGPRLTKLDLHASTESPKSAWADLVKALGQAPSLEWIRFHDFLPSGPPSISLASTPITLPHLKHAIIQDGPVSIEGLFSCVRVPRSASIFLPFLVTHETMEQGGVDGLLSRLKEFWTREEFFARSFHVMSGSTFDIGFWDSADIQSVPLEENHLSTPNFSLFFDHYSVPSWLTNKIMASLITQFNFDSLRHLSLSHTGIIEYTVFETVLARPPNIEEIHLQNLQIATLLHLLIRDPGSKASLAEREGYLEDHQWSPESPRTRPLYFPGLKTMSLTDISFDREGKTFKSLIDALKLRSQGWGIAKVVIKGATNLGREDAGRLKAACPDLKVFWGGAEVSS